MIQKKDETMAVKSAFLAVLALTTAVAVAPASAQDLITLDKKAIQALPSKTSPLKITSLPLLQAGGDVVALRVSLPANTDIAPHAHPAGKVGLGDSFNEAALKSLSAGEMVVFRDTDPQHFARTGNSPVELLLVAAPKAAVSQALPGVK
jgi:hypothetical protein